MTKERVIDLVRKLRAKAEDASVTEEEAALYAAKVSELLAAHNLSEACLEIEEQEEVSEVEHKDTVDPWRTSVTIQTAELYFCKIYYHHKWVGDKLKKTFMFVGKPHNIEVAIAMVNYLTKTTVRLAVQYANSDAAKRSYGYTFTKARNGFARGCGIRLARRLQEMRLEQTRSKVERNVNGNPANLPALYEDENKLIVAYMQKLNLKKGRQTKGPDTSGSHAANGARAANDISLNTQLKGNNGAASARLISN